jgi:hypothetical protein
MLGHLQWSSSNRLPQMSTDTSGHPTKRTPSNAIPQKLHIFTCLCRHVCRFGIVVVLPLLFLEVHGEVFVVADDDLTVIALEPYERSALTPYHVVLRNNLQAHHGRGNGDDICKLRIKLLHDEGPNLSKHFVCDPLWYF